MPGDVVRSLLERNDGNVRGLSSHAEMENWPAPVLPKVRAFPSSVNPIGCVMFF
jgi:hypothetical protein